MTTFNRRSYLAEDLPLKGHYRLEVRPVECFCRKDAAIASDMVTAEQGPEQQAYDNKEGGV